MALPIGFAAWTASVLAPYSGGVLLFIIVALASAAVALALLFAVSAAYFASRRLRAQPATFGGLFESMARHSEFLGAWAEQIALPGGGAFNPFVLPAALDDGCDPETASQRAASFVAQAPQALEAVMPLHERAKGTATATLALLLPAVIGFFSVPALSYAGYPVPPLGAYSLGLALAALAWWGGMLLLAWRVGCAFIHAGAVYAYATGQPAARERVLAKLPLDLVWPPR